MSNIALGGCQTGLVFNLPIKHLVKDNGITREHSPENALEKCLDSRRCENNT